MAAAAPAPGISTRPLQRRRMLQDQGVRAEALITSPADQAAAVGNAVQNAVSSGSLATNLQQQGLGDASVRLASSSSPAVAANASPATSNANAAPPPKSGSSTPIGAIVGGVVGGLAALAVAAVVVGRCTQPGRDWREERKKQIAAWKERRQERKAEQKEWRKAYQAGDYEYDWRKYGGRWAGKYGSGHASGKHWEPSDLEKIIEGKSKGTASLHNLSTVDSVSSVQRVANLAGVGALPHNFGPASNTINYGAAAPHMVLTVQDKDSAEIYATKEKSHEWPEMEQDGWQLDPTDISISKTPTGEDILIGQGGFGAVYLGDLHSSTPVAVKVLKASDARSREAFLNEMSILKSLHHSNIVQFLGACVFQNTVALVTEYMPEGDLWHALSSDNAKALSFYKRGRSIALDIARGTIYMHNKKIIHLDLKSANILLSRDGSAKIADVGLAKIMSRELTQVSARGSFDWVAPEVLRGEEINDRADIWSLSVLLWEICSGERPQNRYIRELRVPEECPQEVSDLISWCRKEPNERPSALEVFEALNSSPMTLEGAAGLPLPGGSPVRSGGGSAPREVVQLSTDLRRGASITQSAGGDRLAPLPDKNQWSRGSKSSRRRPELPPLDTAGHHSSRSPSSFRHTSPSSPPQEMGAPLKRLNKSGGSAKAPVGISPFIRVEPEIVTSTDSLSDVALLQQDPGQKANGSSSQQPKRPVGGRPSPFAAPQHQETPLSVAERSRSSRRK